MQDSINSLFFRQYKGGIVVLNGDFQYHKLREFKNGSSVWRCSAYKKSKCPGTITIKGNKLIKASQRLHSCEPVVGRNIVTREIDNLKHLVTKSDKPVTQLYDETYNSYQNKGLNFVAPLPPLSSVQHCLYDMRNKALGVLKTVYHVFEEVQIPVIFSNFILADYYYEGSRIILFCLPFAELYSIHGDVGSTMDTTNVIPLIFALMPNKTQKTYETLFNLIKSTVPNFSPSIFHCDFELAVINALTEVLPEIQLKGCYYHWSRAVWKKAKVLSYTKRKGHKRIVGLTAVLALLPIKDIVRGWEYVKGESQDLGMERFINYFECFWLKNKFKQMLSVYGQRHRTNNVLEGWHSKINKRVTKGWSSKQQRCLNKQTKGQRGPKSQSTMMII